ncbi:hypothetical protein RIF29_09697 [Crotalaria pallida]|uniref:Thioredoxin-like protein 4A n=1 Tax=Crotalaria pallida TaxID=3830 RepID=A0AAN9FYA6_CROPI
MSYLLPHLHSGWAVDQAILAEEERLVVIRFGHDWDETCMQTTKDFRNHCDANNKPRSVVSRSRIAPSCLETGFGRTVEVLSWELAPFSGRAGSILHTVECKAFEWT